jgi:hypothetical protein
MLWEALAGRHPFWGVPLPQVATTIEAGAPPLQPERPDISRRLLEAVESALSIDPARRPQAALLAHLLREALEAPRREPRPRTRGLRPARLTLPATPAAVEARALSSGLAGLTALGGGSLLPFWPPGLLVLLTLAAAASAWRYPRTGLALALFAPVFPLGNESRGAALAYIVAALIVLTLSWRDARAGLVFVVGPLLGAIGGLAFVPLAVQPARGWLRRGTQAALAVLTAALVAGLRGDRLPLVDERVGDLGVHATPHPGTVVSAVWSTLRDRPAIATTAIVVAIAAALLPAARSRGPLVIGALCAAEAAAILGAGPSIAPTSIAIGSWLLCGVLTLGRAR